MSTGLMATPGQKLGARQQDDPARCHQLRLCPGSVSSNEDNAVHRKPKPRRAHCWPSCPTVKSRLGRRVTPQARGSEGKEAGADAHGAGLTPPASKTVSVYKGGTRAGLWALVTRGSTSSEPLGLGGNYLIRTRSGGKRGYGSPGTRTTGRCLRSAWLRVALQARLQPRPSLFPSPEAGVPGRSESWRSGGSQLPPATRLRAVSSRDLFPCVRLPGRTRIQPD